MSNIKIKNLTFGFDGQLNNLFSDVSLDIDESWKLGLVGRNGRGKTTFLKLLTNQFNYQGEILCKKEFFYFPPRIQNQKEMTYDALNQVFDFEQWRLERECNLLSLDVAVLWRPFCTLSGGEKTKVLLALLFSQDFVFPLIDEPTNHLDSVAREQIKSYLKQKKQGFIVVSHNKDLLAEVTNHTLAIEKEKIILYKGNYEIYVHEKKLQDNLDLEQNQKLQKEIKRLEKTTAEKIEWANVREKNNHGRNIAERMMKRAKAIEHRKDKKIAYKNSLIRNTEDRSEIQLAPIFNHKKTLLQVKDFSIYLEEGHLLFEPISFTLLQGEQVALHGRNGVGKSTLMKFIRNPESFQTVGEYHIAANLLMSSVDQEFQFHEGRLKEFALQYGIDYTGLLGMLSKLGMERRLFETPIENLSMGQMKRVELAKSLIQQAELYIWDEPLNYLDDLNQQQLIEAVHRDKPTLLFAEHDKYFNKNIATKQIELVKNS